jgi:hypothetical protein
MRSMRTSWVCEVRRRAGLEPSQGSVLLSRSAFRLPAEMAKQALRRRTGVRAGKRSCIDMKRAPLGSVGDFTQSPSASRDLTLILREQLRRCSMSQSSPSLLQASSCLHYLRSHGRAVCRHCCHLTHAPSMHARVVVRPSCCTTCPLVTTASTSISISTATPRK